MPEGFDNNYIIQELSIYDFIYLFGIFNLFLCCLKSLVQKRVIIFFYKNPLFHLFECFNVFFLPKFKYPTTYSQCLRKLRLNQSGHRDKRLPKFYKTSISRHGFKSFDFNRCSWCIYCQHTPYQRLLHLIRKDQ